MIAQSSRYALAALVRLADLPAGQFLGADVLARMSGAPRNYLGKLLQTLAGTGVLISRKGPGGGFRLAGPPAGVSLLDVVDPLENVGRWSDCFLGEATCSDETACAVHEQWAAFRDHYLHFLRQTTLADLVGKDLGGNLAATASREPDSLKGNEHESE